MRTVGTLSSNLGASRARPRASSTCRAASRSTLTASSMSPIGPYGLTEAGASSRGLARRPRNDRSNRRAPRSEQQDVVPPDRSWGPEHERARSRSQAVMPTGRPTRQNPCRRSEEPGFHAQPPPGHRRRRRPVLRALPKQCRVRPLRAPPRRREGNSHPPGSATYLTRRSGTPSPSSKHRVHRRGRRGCLHARRRGNWR